MTEEILALRRYMIYDQLIHSYHLDYCERLKQ
jgi:hypothetical protein